MIGSAMLLFIQSLQGAKADYLVMARVKHSQKLSAPLQNHLNSLATPDPSNNHDDSSLLSADSEELWCCCQQPESGEMIAYDHVQCPIVWFHTTFVQVKRTPKGNW